MFDTWNGYNSVALDERHRHYTTFITPWGRYRYLTAPQGYIASWDAYTAQYDSLVAHVGSKTKCIDDALLWSETIEESFHQAVEWLQIYATNGITLNPRKFHFAKDELEFAGFMITPTGVRPAPPVSAAEWIFRLTPAVLLSEPEAHTFPAPISCQACWAAFVEDLYAAADVVLRSRKCLCQLVCPEEGGGWSQ